MFQQIPSQPRLTAAQRGAVQAMQSQFRATPWPYHSTGKFTARVESGAYVLNAGTEIRLFSYGKNKSKESAGFTQEDGKATAADTNLTVGNQTIGGQNVYVRGLCMQLMPRSLDIAPNGSAPANIFKPDSTFIGALFECVSVELSLNGGENRYNLGTLGMIPGGGGLTGGATPTAEAPSIVGVQQQPEIFPTNGWPTWSNKFRVKEGLIWKATGSDNADSQLDIILTVTRNISIPVPSDRTAELDPSTDAFGITGFTAPTALSVEIKGFLDGLVKGARTQVS